VQQALVHSSTQTSGGGGGGVAAGGGLSDCEVTPGLQQGGEGVVQLQGLEGAGLAHRDSMDSIASMEQAGMGQQQQQQQQGSQQAAAAVAGGRVSLGGAVAAAAAGSAAGRAQQQAQQQGGQAWLPPSDGPPVHHVDSFLMADHSSPSELFARCVCAA
jgi:hypothetical protein